MSCNINLFDVVFIVIVIDPTLKVPSPSEVKIFQDALPPLGGDSRKSVLLSPLNSPRRRSRSRNIPLRSCISEATLLHTIRSPTLLKE